MTDAPSKAARVAEIVRAMIRDGRLREGDALPSTRAFATELGVARGTVVAAYEQLDGEGYLDTRHGAVSRVAVSFAGVREAAPASSAPRAAAPAPIGAAAPAPLIDLTPGLPRITAISPREWRAAWRHAAAQPLDDVFPDRLGEEPLRAEIAKQLGFSRGFAPAIRDVIVTAGTSEAVSLLAEALGAGARIAVENPGYRSGRLALRSAGAELLGVGVDENGMLLDELRARHRRRALAAVMVTPSHQYPLGGVMPLARRQELLDWAAAEGVLVIEDDYDSEFRHHGAPLPALAAIDAAGSVVHLGSFSKTLSPQLRTGYLVTPARGAFADRLRAVREARGAAVAVPVQLALTQLLAGGALRRHIARARRDYGHKREMVGRMLAALPGVRVEALAGGLHAVVRWDGAADASDLVARVRDRGVAVAALQDYVVEGSGLRLDGLVLGYGPVSATALAAALEEIRAELSRAASAPPS